MWITGRRLCQAEKTKCKGPEVDSVFREQERSHCGWSAVSKRESGRREGWPYCI